MRRRLVGTFTAVLLVMLALKLAILGCKPSDTIITSPSGHTAAATFVYGGMIVLITRSRIAASLAIGAALAVLFGLSRIMVHAHTMPDVLIGGGVGIIGLGCFAHRAARIPDFLRPAWLLLVCVPLALLLHGARLNLEPHIRGASHWLGLTVCFS
jgi:membrane-associated phospholipid phosphatase